MKPSPISFSALLDRLADSDSRVLRQAISSIMRRRNEREQAFASLLSLLNDPEDQVCKAALLSARNREDAYKPDYVCIDLTTIQSLIP